MLLPRARNIRNVRKRLSADALHALLRAAFADIAITAGATIPLVNVLMSALAMFSLKDPSLLAFDRSPAAMRT